MNDQNLRPEEKETNKPEIYVNDYGATKDSTVVVEEQDRTVLLTENETIIIPKATTIDLPPKNRARKVYAGMWGNTELITVGLGLLAVLTTVLLFVFLVLPAQREYENRRARRDELSKKWEDENKRYGSISNTQTRVNELIASVDAFQSRLPNETIGRTALYQRLNGLIAAYGLTNTTGPDYAPLEIKDETRRQQSEQEQGRSKFISIYPGMYVTMTLDGPYQNLRRFIREIETSKEQFVIVSAIELEPSENKEKQDNNAQPNQLNQPPSAINYQQPQQNPIGNPNYPSNPNQFPSGGGALSTEKIDRGKTRGETVTLRLEIAAYFRRTDFAPQIVETGGTR